MGVEETPTRSRKRERAVLDDAYLPLDELATYAGLSVRTLRDYLHDRRHPLPHYFIGGKIVVRRSAYDQWVERFRIEDTPREDAIDALIDARMRGA